MKKIIVLLAAALLALSACQKYLDAKSNQSLVVISKLEDLQALLDNYNNVNVIVPSADEVSSDEYYLSFASFQALTFEETRNMYTWQPANVFFPYTALTNDWTQAYNMVQLANTVLDHMNDIARTADNAAVWDNVKGQALFLRSYAFFKTAAIWSLAYDPATAESDLGIPLRLSSNFNLPSVRSTIGKTYAQILADVQGAIRTLPNTAVHPYRSGKPAAYALAARTLLSMRSYEPARLYADSCLQLYSTLIDFNTYTGTVTYPITQFNKEVIYDTYGGGSGAQPLAVANAKVDSTLYRSYTANDLRKTLFFSANTDGSMRFRGSFHGTANPFNGLAVDEVYLIRAECYARANNTSLAMNDLNTVLLKRWKNGTFVPFTASSPADALSKILTERQKELIMRGTRWTDIKRLNKEGAGITLKRILNGQTFTLPPNDLRFALVIPEDIIALTGMTQNPR